ncbi:MAG: hypothetical protein AAFN78_20630 [Pseudomonadota bacterium]
MTAFDMRASSVASSDAPAGVSTIIANPVSAAAGGPHRFIHAFIAVLVVARCLTQRSRHYYDERRLPAIVDSP